jgi:hypothetical protein
LSTILTAGGGRIRKEESTVTVKSRGRPPKYAPEEVRHRLIEAGREALERHGPGCGLDPVTLDDAIADAAVPRGSAYRLWQEDSIPPQKVFRQAVQLEVLRGVGLGAPMAAAKFKETYEQFSAYATSDDPEDRQFALRSVLRIVANHSYEMLVESRRWRIYRALRANVIAKAVPQLRAINAVRRGEEAQLDAYVDLYTEIADTFGFRIREPFTIREFAAASFALNEGIAARVTNDFRDREIVRPTGRNGEPESWTLFAIGLEALSQQFFDEVSAHDESPVAG